jgi:hypothetical protein
MTDIVRANMVKTEGDTDLLIARLKKGGYPDPTRQQVYNLKCRVGNEINAQQAPKPEPKVKRKHTRRAKLAETPTSKASDTTQNPGTMPPVNGHDPAGTKAGAKPNGEANGSGKASTPAVDVALSLAERRAKARAKIAEGLAELEALEPETLEAEGKIERLKGAGLTLVFEMRQEVPPSTTQ